MEYALRPKLKAVSHGAIFLATCNPIVLFLTHQTFVKNLHLLRVELRCKLQEKLHRVTGPLT